MSLKKNDEKTNTHVIFRLLDEHFEPVKNSKVKSYISVDGSRLKRFYPAIKEICPGVYEANLGMDYRGHVTYCKFTTKGALDTVFSGRWGL